MKDVKVNVPALPIGYAGVKSEERSVPMKTRISRALVNLKKKYPVMGEMLIPFTKEEELKYYVSGAALCVLICAPCWTVALVTLPLVALSWDMNSFKEKKGGKR